MHRAHEAPAVEDRHAHIEQNQLGPRFAVYLGIERIQRFLTVGCRKDSKTLEVERVRDRREDRRVVVDYQYRAGAHKLRRAGASALEGRATWKVLPSPGVLSIQILPSCCSTIPRAMYNPRPIPA